jgi:hypothetical protein
LEAEELATDAIAELQEAVEELSNVLKLFENDKRKCWNAS